MKETLVNFENEKQKKSWKKNNYTDYIKSKIQNISEKTEKEYKIEFLLHRFSLENTKENLEILDLFCENINFNLESIWWNLKQNFASWNYEIIKYFFENFEINTLEKFQNLSSLITCREKQNIKLIVEKLEIKDESDLLEIIDVIRYTKLNLLEFFLNKDFVKYFALHKRSWSYIFFSWIFQSKFFRRNKYFKYFLRKRNFSILKKCNKFIDR